MECCFGAFAPLPSQTPVSGVLPCPLLWEGIMGKEPGRLSSVSWCCRSEESRDLPKEGGFGDE